MDPILGSGSVQSRTCTSSPCETMRTVPGIGTQPYMCVAGRSEEDDGLPEHDDADDDDFDPSKKARKVHPRSAPESPLGYVSIAR